MNAEHVVPTDDLIAHGTDDECPCGPTPKFSDGGVVMVHHSLDGREIPCLGCGSEFNPQHHIFGVRSCCPDCTHRTYGDGRDLK